jgi:hypothetical protein
MPDDETQNTWRAYVISTVFIILNQFVMYRPRGCKIDFDKKKFIFI